MAPVVALALVSFLCFGLSGDPARPVSATNDEEVVLDDDLHQRASELFHALQTGRTEASESMWFPRDPFLALKNVKDPGLYWDNLHAAYLRDVAELHKTLGLAEEDSFLRLEVVHPARWVRPGEEANRIGYFRTYRARLTYLHAGKERSIELHTMITWHGHLYVTHLRRVRH